jgi:hypothetical protein
MSANDSKNRLWGEPTPETRGDHYRPTRLFHTHLVTFNKDDMSPSPYITISVNGVCSTSLRSLYLRCDISTNPEKYPPGPAIFSPRSKIIILFYVVSKLKHKMSRFHRKTASFYVLKIKFVDISHHRSKPRRDIG